VPRGATRRQPPMTPQQIKDMVAWLRDHGASSELDVIVEGETPANDGNAALEKIGAYAEAGATWWVESRWDLPSREPSTMQAIRDRLAAGPPRV